MVYNSKYETNSLDLIIEFFAKQQNGFVLLSFYRDIVINT